MSLIENLAVSEHAVGHLYGERVLSLEELVLAFRACLGLWNLLLKPVGKG